MCDPILVTVLKMKPLYSQPSRENATPSSGTSGVSSRDKLYGVGQASVLIQKLTHAAHAPPASVRQLAATTISDRPVNLWKGWQTAAAPAQTPLQHFKMHIAVVTGPDSTGGLIITKITTKMVKDLRRTIFIVSTSSWPLQRKERIRLFQTTWLHDVAYSRRDWKWGRCLSKEMKVNVSGTFPVICK